MGRLSASPSSCKATTAPVTVCVFQQQAVWQHGPMTHRAEVKVRHPQAVPAWPFDTFVSPAPWPLPSGKSTFLVGSS